MLGILQACQGQRVSRGFKEQISPDNCDIFFFFPFPDRISRYGVVVCWSDIWAPPGQLSGWHFYCVTGSSLIECGLEHWGGSCVQQESVKGRGSVAGETSALREGWGGQVGEDLHSCQAAVSPLLMMTGRGSQQAANAYCRGVIGRCCYHSKGQGSRSGANGNLKGGRWAKGKNEKKNGVWCHLENCKPINQWGIIARIEGNSLRSQPVGGAGGWQETPDQQAELCPHPEVSWNLRPRMVSHSIHSILPPFPWGFFFFSMKDIGKNALSKRVLQELINGNPWSQLFKQLSLSWVS